MILCEKCGHEKILRVCQGKRENGKTRNPLFRCQYCQTQFVKKDRANNRIKYRFATNKSHRKNHLQYNKARIYKAMKYGLRSMTGVTNRKTFKKATLRGAPWDVVDDDFLMSTTMKGQKLAEFLGRTLVGIQKRRRTLRDNNAGITRSHHASR